MAEYSDWEISTADKATMDAGVRLIGFTQGDGFLQGVRYSIYIYGTKYVQQGTKWDPVIGFNVPNYVALPGYFAILRWYSSSPFPPSGMHIPNNVTIIPIPADSPHVFAQLRTGTVV
jgi:hypothetical protein